MVSNIKGLNKDAAAFREFARENFKPDFLPKPASVLNPEIINFYKSNVRMYRNEIDIIGMQAI